MPVKESDLLRLAADLYDTISDASLWVPFLDHFARVFGTDMAFLQRHHLSEQQSEILNSTGLTPLFSASYNQHYSRLNVWRNRSIHLYKQGHAVIDQQMCPRAILEKSEFYNDYLVRLGGVFSLAGVIKREADEALVLTALRSPRRAAFHERDARALETLLPHLTRACAVQEQLQILEQGNAVLDSIAIGIVMLNGSGKCVYMNRAADEIFKAEDGLALRGGLPQALDASSSTRLRHAIRRALAPGRSLTPIAAVCVERPSMRRAYQILVAPFRRSHPHSGASGPPGVVLVTTDPEQRAPAPAHVLRQLYGLTDREAAVVVQLMQGRTVEEAADALHMRYETARSHLRHIFGKTGTRRQSDLLLLLGRLPSISGEQSES